MVDAVLYGTAVTLFAMGVVGFVVPVLPGPVADEGGATEGEGTGEAGGDEAGAGA